MTAAVTSPARPLVLADLLPGRLTLVRDLVLVLGGAAFVGLAAQLSVPIPGSPVPVTGQTFAVLLAGAALGTWRGMASMALYLLAGMAGVPWFAEQTSGASIPTLGYIIGFVVAGGLVGWLAERGGDRTPPRTVATMVAGTVVIYTFGVPYLMSSLDMDFATALDKGLVPFLLGDAIKVALAAGLLPGAWTLVRRFTGER